MGIPFIDENYVEKGLCCMYLDNNKQRPALFNLKIGTYSENTQAAYGLYRVEKLT